MFDEISKVLDVECIETDSETDIEDMDNMGLGLGLPTSNSIYDVAVIEEEDDDDEEVETESEDDEESQKREIRRKVLKNMTKLVDSGMSALPHVIKEVKFTEDNKVFTTAANYISMMGKLNEQLLSMTIEPEKPEITEKTKKGEKGNTQSTVTNNIIMTANDVFDRLNNR